MLDKPELRSPTPCPRGVYCQYKLPNPETKELELACCRMVHPGEEGNGRRLFPARTAPDGREQPACVRLTGKAGFYERCRLKQPWRVWATEHGIPLPPTDIPWVQVERGPILRNRHVEMEQPREAVRPSSAAPVSGAAKSASDWPPLPYRTPSPPPRLNLSGHMNVHYGFSAAESLYTSEDDFPMPPQIQRLRTERLYECDEVNEDRCASPSIPFRTRADRIHEKIKRFSEKGVKFVDALCMASNEVTAEIDAERGEGGMDAVD